MSNFFEKTIHPETGAEEEAEWLDDYYGRHQYGVRFPDGKIFWSGQISRTLIKKRLTDMVIANCEADVAEGKYDMSENYYRTPQEENSAFRNVLLEVRDHLYNKQDMDRCREMARGVLQKFDGKEK
jgi:hypothetical protein